MLVIAANYTIRKSLIFIQIFHQAPVSLHTVFKIRPWWSYQFKF